MGFNSLPYPFSGMSVRAEFLATEGFKQVPPKSGGLGGLGSGFFISRRRLAVRVHSRGLLSGGLRECLGWLVWLSGLGGCFSSR
jgi:hypothetical protein